ncbi:ArnT family glycosyltransferase [Thioclava kandeliae]|uniref:Glycosyltransferase family 39 protein n=1 Tax=Thioclava kandeliae TaxID=3070818 RepID=A0ABV1SDK0_9RHOB
MSLLNKSPIWLSLFGLYFAVQATLRILLGDRLNIDEAEAFLWAQGWSWGYGPQPPLYIWLQRLVFLLTGPSVAGLAILKALTLWATFALSFALMRRWVPPTRIWMAGLATLMLFWLPELVWESQRIRTHNVTVTIAALAFFWALLRLRERPSLGNYAALGLIAGLGLLTKWSFAPLLLAGFGSLLLSAGGRRLLRDRKALLWLVLPLAICLPTFSWIARHAAVALASADKLDFEGGQGPLVSSGLFLTSTATSVLTFLALPVLVLGAFALSTLHKPTRHDAGESGPLRRTEQGVVLGIVGLTLMLILAGGLLSGATELRLRWLLPILVILVPMAALWVLDRLGRRRRIGLVAATLCLPVLLCVAMGVMLKTDPPFKSLDLDGLQEALAAENLTGTVLAKEIIAGNMALRFPELTWHDPATQLVRPCPEGPFWLLGLAEDPAVMAYLEFCQRRPSPMDAIALPHDHAFTLYQALPH